MEAFRRIARAKAPFVVNNAATEKYLAELLWQAADGPDRAGLEDFGRALAFDDFRIHFAGHRPDLPALLGLAEVVWVAQERGGVNLALEAVGSSISH